jgi:hypothetical protein
LEDVVLASMKEVGSPKWDEKDHCFAKDISNYVSIDSSEEEAVEYRLKLEDMPNMLHEGIVEEFIGRDQACRDSQMSEMLAGMHRLHSSTMRQA